ncbi:TELO2-interacting protein 2 [Xylocopa sonorina]|uniref:TELO2-interacting protein 2 n=1 Tax=Xylocopa sonorina TaxID=1818115 RepID=UPI00403AD903
MNNLSEELEALKITADFNQECIMSACTALIRTSYVPEKTVGASRPCEEEDFRDCREIIERNLRNIESMLQHIIRSCNEKDVLIDLNVPAWRTFTIDLLLLVGEQYEKNVWNTVESASISKGLVNEILQLYRYQCISQFLMEQDNFNTVLLTLRPKLTKDTWRSYPAAVACYKWIIYQVEEPSLYNHIENVLPTALLIIDDNVPENVVLGLECLHQILQHSHLKKGLIDSGYANVILHALERLTHQKEAKYVILVYVCIKYLLSTIERWDNTSNVFEWMKRDDILAVLFDNMEFEQNVELRRVYMLSLPELLTHIGCAKWCKKLTQILSDYCEHHTDLNTLKATMQTAKIFLVMFHPRVAAHCVPLYTIFLKLHIDLTKTPVFDKEIMENLEDCICLLYKWCPNVRCAVMNDDRMQIVIKNSMQIVCFGDSKYFQ